MTIMVSRKQGDKRGWLWRRGSENEPWSKVFASLKASELRLYRDDKATQPLEVLSLLGSTVQESGAEEGRPPGQSSRIINIQLPSPEAEELRNLLPQCNLTFRADDKLVQLAATDSSDHMQWLKQLKQVNSVHQLSSGLVVEEDRILNGFRSTSGRHARRHANALEPSLAVSMYLSSPATTSGPELLLVLSRAQQALQEGVMNMGAARDEARRSGFALNSVHRQLREIELSVTHRLRDGEEEGNLALVNDIRDWLEQALSFMHEVDTHLENLMVKEPPLAPDWVTFAHDTMLKLQILEEALHLGQYAYQQQQSCSSNGGVGVPRKSFPVTRSAMPFSYWKHKIAL